MISTSLLWTISPFVPMHFLSAMTHLYITCDQEMTGHKFYFDHLNTSYSWSLQVELRKASADKDKAQAECDKYAYDLERAELQHNKAQTGLDKSQEEVARLQVTAFRTNNKPNYFLFLLSQIYFFSKCPHAIPKRQKKYSPTKNGK